MPFYSFELPYKLVPSDLVIRIEADNLHVLLSSWSIHVLVATSLNTRGTFELGVYTAIIPSYVNEQPCSTNSNNQRARPEF